MYTETKINKGNEDTEKEAEKGRGNEMWHGERNRERGRVPKAVHYALLLKGSNMLKKNDKMCYSSKNSKINARKRFRRLGVWMEAKNIHPHP